MPRTVIPTAVQQQCLDLGTVGKTDGLTQYASGESTPTVNVNVGVVELPMVLLALTVNVFTWFVVGVPEITPVEVLRLKPAGSEPVATE